MKDDQDLEEWLVSTLPCDIAYFGAMISVFQPLILFPAHLYMAFMNVTTWESIKGSTISYLKNWTNTMSPFSKGLTGNFVEFCTMNRTRPSYRVPKTQEELAEWKSNNHFLSNDRYDCC